MLAIQFYTGYFWKHIHKYWIHGDVLYVFFIYTFTTSLSLPFQILNSIGIFLYVDFKKLFVHSLTRFDSIYLVSIVLPVSNTLKHFRFHLPFFSGHGGPSIVESVFWMDVIFLIHFCVSKSFYTYLYPFGFQNMINTQEPFVWCIRRSVFSVFDVHVYCKIGSNKE